jgi:hypothetical protein
MFSSSYTVSRWLLFSKYGVKVFSQVVGGVVVSFLQANMQNTIKTAIKSSFFIKAWLFLYKLNVFSLKKGIK